MIEFGLVYSILVYFCTCLLLRFSVHEKNTTTIHADAVNMYPQNISRTHFFLALISSILVGAICAGNA